MQVGFDTGGHFQYYPGALVMIVRGLAHTLTNRSQNYCYRPPQQFPKLNRFVR